MKYSLILFVSIGFLFFSCNSSNSSSSHTDGEINWMSWEEAIALNKKAPKKIFIDMYTDWCGWCKKMDKSTFVEENVVKIMNDNFYAVKFDAEQKEEIVYKGQAFKYVPSGRKGYHELAAAFLNGKLSYPSFVFLNEKEEVLFVSPGYKKAPEMLQELEFVSSEIYKQQTLGEYKSQQ